MHRHRRHPGAGASGADANPTVADISSPTPAAAPCPPNWTQSLTQAAAQVQSQFIKIPVAADTAEHRELATLFGGSNSGAIQVERVVNPELWRRFTRARADLLTAKSDDLALLKDLGLSQEEIAQKANVNLNFDKRHLQNFPYRDNVLLLFHGTRGSIEPILSQGLDDRLGNGGNFGRGIYFADDPSKSMQYDMNGVLIVCAVMLGDCLAVQGRTGTGVREPEKAHAQKRNHLDQFFDSIVGRASHNEFVIFNRAQCCPLYTIAYNRSGSSARMSNGVPRRHHGASYHYGRPTPTLPTVPTHLGFVGVSGANQNWQQAFVGKWGSLFGIPTAPGMPVPPPTVQSQSTRGHGGRPVSAGRGDGSGSGRGNRHTHSSENEGSDRDYSAARHQTPAFAWHSTGVGHGHGQHGTSPFCAHKIFRAMAADQVQPDAAAAANDYGVDRFQGAGAAGYTAPRLAQGEDLTNDTDSISLKLAQIASLGFYDVEKNQRLLKQFGYDPDQTVDYLLDERGTNGSIKVAYAQPDAPPNQAGVGVGDDPRLDLMLIELSELGFFDVDENTRLLRRFGFDMQRSIDHLLTEQFAAVESLPNAQAAIVQAAAVERSRPVASGADAYSSNVAPVLPTTKVETKAENPPVNQSNANECPICCTEYRNPADWKTLTCGHKTCMPCFFRIRSSGTTMSGATHTWVKCPFCQHSTGIQVGDCPTGTMTVQRQRASAAGYEGYGSLMIQYHVGGTGQHSASRTAYLPDNPEGSHVLALLRTAWDRKLCFTIGRSSTTGATNAVVWNIHHKTALNGGGHGFPDPTYLSRVTQELKEFGVQ